MVAFQDTCTSYYNVEILNSKALHVFKIININDMKCTLQWVAYGGATSATTSTGLQPPSDTIVVDRGPMGFLSLSGDYEMRMAAQFRTAATPAAAGGASSSTSQKSFLDKFDGKQIHYDKTDIETRMQKARMVRRMLTSEVASRLLPNNIDFDFTTAYTSLVTRGNYWVMSDNKQVAKDYGIDPTDHSKTFARLNYLPCII